MSKKFIFILISAVLGLLLLSLIGYYFIIQNGNVNNADGTTSGFRSFFPFGGDSVPTNTSTSTESTASETPNTNQTSFTLKLRKISSEPVSGAGVLDIKAGTVVRYIEKATGHIFETEMFSPKSERISNTTIPLVYDAVWGGGAGSLVARYLSDDGFTVDTYSLVLKNATTSTASGATSTLSGIAFPKGILDVSSFGTSVFYLQQGETLTQGLVSSFDGSKKKLIWNSEIKEINSQFVNEKTVALNTKPYQGVNGYLYFVDTGNGQIKSVLPATPGLSSIVSTDTNLIFYLRQDSRLESYAFDRRNNSRTKVTPATFPEKCVWSKKEKNIMYCAVPQETLDSASLTSWYQGLVSYRDDIWKYDVENGISVLLANISYEGGEPIDVIKPTLSDNEQYIVFINKIDNSLWSLDLTK